MVRKIPQHVKIVPRVPLPSLLLDNHKTEQLGVYLMFVNGHVFLVTTLFNINSSSIMNMLGRVATESENGLNTTISAFKARKLNIEAIVCDNKFEAVCKALRPSHVCH